MSAREYFSVALQVQVPAWRIEESMGYSPQVLGDNLASQVIEWMRDEGLDVYPPLSVLESVRDIDTGLLALIEEVAWLACEYTRKELRKCLGSQHRTLTITEIHNVVYSPPRVRRRQANEWHLLAEHYAPHQVQLQMRAERPGPWDARAVQRWVDEELPAVLGRSFDSVSAVTLRG